MINTLIVDDDFRVADLHAEFVRRVEGFSVVAVAHTAAAALDAAARHRPDLILLDFYLPDRNGLSLLAQLRHGPGPHPDVIAITAARDLETVRIAMQHGVVHYLVKPFGFRALSERLTAYRTLWEQTRASGEVAQVDVDRLFALMRTGGPSSQLPKGYSEATLALIRAQFGPGADLSAVEISQRVGVSRATAQRYLALLVRSGYLQLHLRYGNAGRPEHRYRTVGP